MLWSQCPLLVWGAEYIDTSSTMQRRRLRRGRFHLYCVEVAVLSRPYCKRIQDGLLGQAGLLPTCLWRMDSCFYFLGAYPEQGRSLK
jgi:hypothetical protein